MIFYRDHAIDITTICLSTFWNYVMFKDKREYVMVHMDRTLEMTCDALTNAGKHITSNVESVQSQWYTKDSVFWLALMMYVLTLTSFV